MMYHGTSFVSQLSWVQDAMMWMLRRMERIDPVSVRQRVDEGLHQINATVSQAHQACVQMGHRLDTLDTSISEALAVGNCAREAELRKQLGAREAVIEERDRQLQILSDDYANKTQSLSKTILSNSLAAERHVLNALESIQHHLDFEKEREAFKLKIQSNDKINKDLVNQLHETRALLSEACTSRAADDELAKLLSDERLVVSRLSAKVQQLEGEVSMSRELQEKWQLNMETVESLRTRVAAACQRLPRVEIMAAKLDNIVRLNSFIHSTAQYLSKEKVWVQQQLAGRNICEGDPMDVDKKIHTQADHDTQIQQFFTQPFQSETFEDRKVQMRSPGDFGSPSPPPTVQQEQKRRREANRPRSIMRFPRGAEHTASSAEGHPSHGSRGGVSEDIIQEIRAGFTHPDRSESTGKLPAHREMGPNYSRHPGI